MADNVLDMSLDGIAPEEKIYPLNFVCQYVSECKDRLVAEETQTVSSVMALRNRIDGILEEAQTWGGMLQLSEEERAFHDSIVSKERALRDECDALITRMTEKDLIFEDMNNLLEQTEPLIGELVFRDSLTVAYNRFFFISRIEELLAECDPQRGFSLAFVDIDNFKSFNSGFGHEFGDEVLKRFCLHVEKFIKELDTTFLVRMGGDEFIIVSYEDFEVFASVLEALRARISSMDFVHGNDRARVSISMGAANTVTDRVDDYAALYRLADDRLYVAKGRGKNALVTGERV